ncbi:hypothetical protein EVAR_94549_1 [Eumeta japonica]|uniref:Uncharacterized protein n=1 Tax=Eumeta variegata TaxID=151549 RepID=A0A4C1UVH8_EUMVA|nr:hypothetical protein EVAR_94549_1 [Eumeta japonica]
MLCPEHIQYEGMYAVVRTLLRRRRYFDDRRAFTTKCPIFYFSNSILQIRVGRGRPRFDSAPAEVAPPYRRVAQRSPPISRRGAIPAPAHDAREVIAATATALGHRRAAPAPGAPANRRNVLALSFYDNALSSRACAGEVLRRALLTAQQRLVHENVTRVYCVPQCLSQNVTIRATVSLEKGKENYKY